MDVNSNERRRQTRSNVYHYLYGAQEFCTRQSLAQALDLSLPTIYQNLTDLVDAGLVRYAGQSQSTGGRKASGLAIVPDARVAVGIALTEDRLRFSAADLRLNEIAYHKVSHTSNFEMEELGALVARELELPLTPALKKLRHTPPQSRMSGAAARRANVLGAYQAVNPEAIRGKTIWLLDDILTTGATASEAARTLLTAGAKQVYCAVVAAANHEKLKNSR